MRPVCGSVPVCHRRHYKRLRSSIHGNTVIRTAGSRRRINGGSPLRKFAALLAVPLLLAASCKSTDADDATAESTTTETSDPVDDTTDATVIEDDRAPGVTDDSIKIGITYVDFDALGDQVNIDHGDYEAAYQAVIDDINESGGIHGRTLEPVYAPVDPSNATSSDEVCTRLTQDEQVFAGVGLFFAESVLCFVDVNGTAVIGGEMTEERLAQAKAPWFTLDPGSDQQVDALQTLVDSGVGEGTVAIVLADTDRPLYESRFTPILEEAGIEPVDVYFFDSGAEPEQQQAATDAALARFETSDVDTILALGQSGPPVAASGLGRSDYRPRLAFNAFNGALSFLRDDTQDHSVLEGSLLVGPYDQDAMLELDGATGECFDIQREAGLTINPPSQVESGEPNQFVSSNIACQQIGLLAAILEAAGENLDYGTFWTAGYGLGEVELPSSPDPFFFGPPPHADGDIPLFLYDFDAQAQEYVLADDATS